MEFLNLYETSIRLGVFVGVFVIMALLEFIFPRRPRVHSRAKRWITNGAIIVIDTIALRLVVPLVAVGMALWAFKNGYGLLNLIALPFWLEVIIGVILLDLAIYFQHVISHKVGFIWAFHRVHHVDRDLDVTSGVRFHPIEIIASMAYKLLVVLLLGPGVIAVFIFEVLLNASAMFNHANVHLPLKLDEKIRLLFVTPDMHRVHHSIHRDEHDTNYGFFLSIWDKLFKTYTPQPRDGHDDMVIGLPEHLNAKPSTLLWSLMLPFKTMSLKNNFLKSNSGETSDE